MLTPASTSTKPAILGKPRCGLSECWAERPAGAINNLKKGCFCCKLKQIIIPIIVYIMKMYRIYVII